MKAFIIAAILGLGLFCGSTAEAARYVYHGGVGVYVTPAPRYYRPYPYYYPPPPPRYYRPYPYHPPYYPPHHYHPHPGGVIIIR